MAFGRSMMGVKAVTAVRRERWGAAAYRHATPPLRGRDSAGAFICCGRPPAPPLRGRGGGPFPLRGEEAEGRMRGWGAAAYRMRGEASAPPPSVPHKGEGRRAGAGDGVPPCAHGAHGLPLSITPLACLTLRDRSKLLRRAAGGGGFFFVPPPDGGEARGEFGQGFGAAEAVPAGGARIGERVARMT